jgi:hypothetical protein
MKIREIEITGWTVLHLTAPLKLVLWRGATGTGVKEYN